LKESIDDSLDSSIFEVRVGFRCLAKMAGGGALVDSVAWEVGGKAWYDHPMQITLEESHIVMLGGDRAAGSKRRMTGTMKPRCRAWRRRGCLTLDSSQRSLGEKEEGSSVGAAQCR
jgi:hypothetical protein